MLFSMQKRSSLLLTLYSEFVESYHDPNWTGVKYMVQIDEAFQNAGVVVPST